ncbi:MAG: ribonuclease III [Bacteroidaceae bacterium]|nr:ribonuclease III [Bacteroidaceae bacterium]
MQSKLSYLLQWTYWKVRLLFKHDRKAYLSLYHHLGIMANNIQLYHVALSHKSMSIIDENGHKLNNERLEFLGDAVLSMSVADYLFKHYKNAPEGMLTTTRTKLVNRQYLNKIALELHFDQLIRKEKAVVSPKNNLVGNSLEAIIGAIYLDRGYRISSQFVVKWLIKNPDYLSIIVHTETNHKARLLEWCQKNKKLVLFNLISETRDENSYARFEMEVYVDDKLCGQGSGRNKKEAEQHACEQALKQINN